MLHLITTPIASLLAAYLHIDSSVVLPLLLPPVLPNHGDISLACFKLAKIKQTTPESLAVELKNIIADAYPSFQVSSSGPYVDMVLPASLVAQALLPILNLDPISSLRSHSGANKTVVIDFSSPNIAKHLGFHHLRSTMIGNALAHLYEAVGWKVIRANFLGDWGTAFGRLISGWKRENLTVHQLMDAKDRVTFLNDLYVRASQAEKENPAFEEEARYWSKKLEDNDPEAQSYWAIFRRISIEEFNHIYSFLGVKFDTWLGEAHYQSSLLPIVEELQSKQLLKRDQGALVVDLASEGLKKPALIQRSDGGYLYATRDLAAADDRWQHYSFDRMIYVTDLGQSLHFKEWFALARLLKRPYCDRLSHVGFGLLLVWDDPEVEGKFGWCRAAARRGKVWLLRDMLEEAIHRAQVLIKEKNPDLPAEQQEISARQVGIGAVVYNDLKIGRTSDVKFDMEEALRFDGDTGPYIQYAHARLCSIERKATDLGVSLKFDATLLQQKEEKDILLMIGSLQITLEKAVEKENTCSLTQVLYKLAGAVQAWLQSGTSNLDKRVLCSDPDLAAARVALARASKNVLAEGLRLLGIGAPKWM